MTLDKIYKLCADNGITFTITNRNLCVSSTLFIQLSKTKFINGFTYKSAINVIINMEDSDYVESEINYAIQKLNSQL